MTPHDPILNLWKLNISFRFYVIESIVTSFLLSYYNWYSKPTINFSYLGNDSGFERVASITLGVFLFRIFSSQILFELAMINFVIRIGQWRNFFIIFLAVVGSVLLWYSTLSLLFTGNLVEAIQFLKAAFTGYGIPLFLGTLFSWWLCYKKMGLKV